MTITHVFDQRLIYFFTLSFMHFEHFMSEKPFRLDGFGERTDHESAIVGNRVRVEIAEKGNIIAMSPFLHQYT